MAIDIFNTDTIDLKNIVCHSGGAKGADTEWERIGKEFGVKTKAYSYKTEYHTSPNKVEISEDDYLEGIKEINKANKYLLRYGISKYMNLLARNWAQVKYSEQIFAIGTIIKVGDKDSKGYINKGKYDIVSGGTGYAAMLGVINDRDLYVFDQLINCWFRWSSIHLKFIELPEVPKITWQNFAGIGSRELQTNGLKAIRDVYEKTFKTDK